MTADFESVLSRGTTNPGAAEASFRNLEQATGLRVPNDYKDFLMRTNGFEGFVSEDHYLILWSVEQIAVLNRAYNVLEFALGLLLFGTDGGDIAYGFDTRHDPVNVIEIPFIGMSFEMARPIADTFQGFLKYLQSS